jgi:hypothetical protein
MSVDAWFGASIVCLRFLAERSCADGRGFSHRSSEASRRETLTGFCWLPSSPLFVGPHLRLSRCYREITIADSMPNRLSDARTPASFSPINPTGSLVPPVPRRAQFHRQLF